MRTSNERVEYVDGGGATAEGGVCLGSRHGQGQPANVDTNFFVIAEEPFCPKKMANELSLDEPLGAP